MKTKNLELKNQDYKLKVLGFLAIALIFSLYALSFAPQARSAALQNVSDLLSTSKPSEKAFHTISFTNQTQIPAGGKISVTFPGSGTNPNNSQASSSTFSFNGLTASKIRAYFPQGSSCSFSINLALNRIICTVQASFIAPGTEMTFMIGCLANSGSACTYSTPTLINPSKKNPSGTADIWNINVRSSDSSDNELDFAKTKIAIIESVDESGTDTSGPTPPPGGITEVTAKVGDYYLSLSGLSSPYASIVLSDGPGNFMASTVADSKGFFSISNILIKKGFSQFCFLAVDFKKVSDSYTCIKIPPATSNVERKNIFLPPTLGLSRSQIGFGGDVYAFGFTMPEAEVNVDFGRGIKKAVFSDSSGYYFFRIGNLPEGRYELYSTAKYKDLTSLSPTKKVDLASLSLSQQIVSILRQYWVLWILLIIIGLMLIFRRFLRLDKLTSIRNKFPRILPITKPHRREPLHHSWMFGY